MEQENKLLKALNSIIKNGYYIPTLFPVMQDDDLSELIKTQSAEEIINGVNTYESTHLEKGDVIRFNKDTNYKEYVVLFKSNKVHELQEVDDSFMIHCLDRNGAVYCFPAEEVTKIYKKVKLSDVLQQLR